MGDTSSGASVVWERLLTIDGAVESPSMFSDRTALWVNGKEIAHRDADGTYDVRLSRQLIRQRREALRAEPLVHLRASSSSDWLAVEVDGARGEELLLELVAAAAAAHRPTRGAMPKPPPQGQVLARRRRFH